MNNKVENISLNNAETHVKNIQIVNADYTSILSVSAEFRAISASVNNANITLVSGGFINSVDLMSLFNWSFNINDQEKCLQLKTHDNIINIDSTVDILPVSSVITDTNDLTFNVSAYFNEISKKTYMTETPVSCIIKNVSVDWNTTNNVHLYFPNGNSLSAKEYNLESMLVKSWNSEDMETGLFVNSDSISGVLAYDNNVLSGAVTQLSLDELNKYNQMNLPVSAGFISNNHVTVIDTNNNVYLHIVDAQLKDTDFNFIIRDQDKESFSKTIERNLKGSSYVDWINFNSDSLKSVTNINFSSTSLLNDNSINVSFTLGCVNPDDLSSFNIRNGEITFTLVNPINWNDSNIIYVNSNESFDIVKIVCGQNPWDFDNSQYVKIIEPESTSNLLDYYEISYQNSEINSVPATVLTPVIPISDSFNTIVEAKFYNPATNEKSPAADQKAVGIVVCSSNIDIVNDAGIYNTPNILETRNGIPSSFVIEDSFNYEYSPLSISSLVQFNFEAKNWTKTADYIIGKDIIQNISEYSPHIDNKVITASAYLTLNNSGTGLNFMLKPVKEFDIIEYGSPMFLESIRPTLIFNVNNTVSSDISVFGYKNFNKEFDEKITVNDEVNIQTTSQNIDGISGTINNFSLPTNELTWEELVSIFPGLYIDSEGMLKGKITDINVINALQKESSLPYLITVNNKTIALTFDYAYLSSYTGKSNEICEFNNIPNGLTLDNNGIIEPKLISKENVSSEYNISFNVYDVFDGSSSLLLSKENIAKLMFFDYEFKNDYLVIDALNGMSAPSSVISSWTKSKIMNEAKSMFGVSSNITYDIEGNSLSCKIDSSNIIFKNTNNNYEALTGEISAFANSNSSYSNYEKLALDTGKIIVPFIPNELTRNDLYQTVSYGKYYQITVADTSKEINLEQFMQNANSNYILPELLWKSPTLNGVYNNGVYTTTDSDYGIFVFEDGSVLYKDNYSNENIIINDNITLIQNENNTYKDEENSIIFRLQNTNLNDYGSESLQNICNYDGFYILNGAVINNNTVTIYIEFTQRKCMINHVSYTFDNTYDDNGNEKLLSAPRQINISGYDNNTIMFTDTYTPGTAVTYDKTFNVTGPVSRIKLELKTNAITDNDYLVKLMNFSLSYIFA